jgi:hypothetical protein
MWFPHMTTDMAGNYWTASYTFHSYTHQQWYELLQQIIPSTQKTEPFSPCGEEEKNLKDRKKLTIDHHHTI